MLSEVSISIYNPTKLHNGSSFSTVLPTLVSFIFFFSVARVFFKVYFIDYAIIVVSIFSPLYPPLPCTLPPSSIPPIP